MFLWNLSLCRDLQREKKGASRHANMHIGECLSDILSCMYLPAKTAKQRCFTKAFFFVSDRNCISLHIRTLFEKKIQKRFRKEKLPRHNYCSKQRWKLECAALDFVITVETMLWLTMNILYLPTWQSPSGRLLESGI